MDTPFTGHVDPRRVAKGHGSVTISTLEGLRRRERLATERRNAQIRVKWISKWLRYNTPEGPDDIAGHLWAPQPQEAPGASGTPGLVSDHRSAQGRRSLHGLGDPSGGRCSCAVLVLSGQKMGNDTWVALAPLNNNLSSEEKILADQALTWAMTQGYESP